MRRVVVLLFLCTLVACATVPPVPKTRGNNLTIYLVFALTHSGQCRAAVYPKEAEHGAIVRPQGNIKWEEVGNCRTEEEGDADEIKWDPVKFKKRGMFGCSGDPATFPPEGSNKSRKAPEATGKYCYAIEGTWNNKPLNIDPEIDVVQ